MTFAGAIKTCLTKYADFRGVATRSEYWYFILFTILVGLVLDTIDRVVFPLAKDASLPEQLMQASGPFGTIGSILLLVPMFAAMVRRMRDAGFSAHWLWLTLAPLAILIVSLVIGSQAISPEDLETQSGWLSFLALLAPSVLAFAAVNLFYFVVTLLKSKAPAKPSPTEQIQDQTGTTA